MKPLEVQQLASGGSFEKSPLKASIIETHISWVLLDKDFVFKIKKPVKLSFLNFSSLPLRRHYCMREFILNQSYSDIYLDVLPIRFYKEKWKIGKGEGDIIDYAVRMKRMKSESKMDIMLSKGKLTQKHIEALANTLASAHKKAEKIQIDFNPIKSRKLFNGFNENKSFVLEHFGEEYAKGIDRFILWGNQFIEHHGSRMKQRADEGFIRLLHGDLHCSNVFIANPPIIFDCIEFDDKLREIDLLSEIGFLCMDIEAHNAPELSNYFLKIYNKKMEAIQVGEDLDILHYYKCFRASIRAKVLLLSAEQHLGTDKFEEELSKAKKYLDLIKNYLSSEVLLEH
jgi:aminoglycoside phosphotransferase family enzyme